MQRARLLPVLLLLAVALTGCRRRSWKIVAAPDRSPLTDQAQDQGQAEPYGLKGGCADPAQAALREGHLVGPVLVQTRDASAAVESH